MDAPSDPVSKLIRAKLDALSTAVRNSKDQSAIDALWREAIEELRDETGRKEQWDEWQASGRADSCIPHRTLDREMKTKHTYVLAICKHEFGFPPPKIVDDPIKWDGFLAIFRQLAQDLYKEGLISESPPPALNLQKTMNAKASEKRASKAPQTTDHQTKGSARRKRKADETGASPDPATKKTKTTETKGAKGAVKGTPAKTVEKPVASPETAGPSTPKNAPASVSSEEVSPSLLTPTEIKVGHIKKVFPEKEKSMAKLAVKILNVMSLVERLNKFQPGDHSRYMFLGYVVNRLNNLDIGLIDKQMASLPPRVAKNRRDDIEARLKAAETGAQKMFNSKGTQMYSDGLAKLVKKPEEYKSAVEARCASIFIHKKHSEAFTKWLRDLDRFARLEHRYFHDVQKAPQKTTTDDGKGGKMAVWVV